MLAPLNTSRDSAGALDPDRAHPLLYVEAGLRSAKFLSAVNEARGSIPKALQSLVSPTLPVPIAESGPEQARRARLNFLAPSNTVPRLSIATWLDSAYSPHLATLSVPTRIRVLADIASCFGRIGYRRKEAFVLREVAALCADSAASDQASLALQDASGNGGLDLRIDTGSNSSRNGTNGKVLPTPRRRAGIASDTQSQIFGVLERVCSACGLDLGPTGDRKGTAGNASPIEQTQISSVETRFGWPAIQLGVLQDAKRMAELVNGLSWYLLLLEALHVDRRRLDPQIIRTRSALRPSLSEPWRPSYLQKIRSRSVEKSRASWLQRRGAVCRWLSSIGVRRKLS